jgi:hypothetical protein
MFILRTYGRTLETKMTIPLKTVSLHVTKPGTFTSHAFGTVIEALSGAARPFPLQMLSDLKRNRRRMFA